MKKCDVIIPVYKSPEWVKLCVYSVFKNTSDNILNKVYLINDCDDELTVNCLNNLSKKYKKVEIIQNEKNLGFIKTVNKGMEKSSADYVLLLNTDCIIAKNTIGKLIDHLEKNNKIGLICPVSSNAANLTLEMFDGFNYMQMDKLLENKFLGKNFDACTVVGNCLMITRECIDKVGYLDTSYGTGYGEETDYQFKAMDKGFEAKVAIDTYVFHKSEVSFGTSKEKQEKLAKNRELFFSRWGDQYNKLMREYEKNDPIKYILSHIDNKDKKLNFEFLIYLIGFSQNAGGVHMTVDMVNYLIINGYNCNILYGFFNEYNEILLFNPIQVNDISKYSFKKLVSTLYTSTYYVKELADEYNVPLIYFAQGYEPYFENGNDYAVAELSYKLVDDILTISNYLKSKYKNTFNVSSTVIKNGVNHDLLYKTNYNKSVKTITLVLRNNVLKGDFILLDIYKNIINKYKDLTLNLLYSNDDICLPFNDNDSIRVNEMKGPFTRQEIASVLQTSDLFIDASFTEGFGLMPLEAMTAGNAIIVSDSGGVDEYMKDGVNGFVIENVNDVEKYLEKIELLLSDNKRFIEQRKECENTIKEYDYDDVIEKYMNYFSKDLKHKKVLLNDKEAKLYKDVLDNKFKVSVDNKPKNIIYKICKKCPKGFRIFVKKAVAKLYKFTNER